MRIPPKAGGLVAALTVTLALAGCVQLPPHVIPTAEPSTTPVFKSDAAALAAAKTALSGYLAASDAIGNDGGKNPSRLAPWVTAADLKTETKEFAELANTGDHLAGASRISDISLQQLTDSSGTVGVTVYLCDNVSESRVLDARGRDITPSNRDNVVPLQVELTNRSPRSKTLVVERSVRWTGADFCS